ncbi:MAG: DUF6496 domain-containing protein [Candidatus Omnitrophota bacterium]
MPRKYGKKTQEKVKEKMEEMKRGELKSGGSGKKVTNPKQAVAIGLSEARKEGDKVPDKPEKSKDKEKEKEKKKKESHKKR